MQQRTVRKIRKGVVVSNKMQKTLTVRVEVKKPHPLYKKYIKQSKTFHVHDEKQEANIGDVVEIMETRPLSKTKCWRLTRIISRSVESLDNQQGSEGKEE